MEELERTLLEYYIVEGYDLEYKHTLDYDVIPGHDLNSNEKMYYDITFLVPSAGFPRVKMYYDITDSIKITSPNDDGGTDERYIEYFQSFNPSVYIDSDGYQGRIIKTPLSEEYYAKFLTRAYIQTPDLTPSEIAIPQSRVIVPYIRNATNGGIKWSLTLDNYDRAFSDPENSIYGGLFKDGKYSPRRETRKYFRLKFQSKYADVLTGIFLDFPRLVIQNRTPPGKKITISGRDEITEYLHNKIDLTTYCVEENLIPVSDSKITEDGEDYYTRFQSINLTKPDYVPGFTKILVNYERTSITFSYNSSTKVYTSSQRINSRFPVTIQNPISCHWIIQDICKQVIDKQEGDWINEYFPVILDFPDFLIRSDVTCQGEEAISIIQKLIEILPGEWLIKVIDGKLAFIVRRKPIDYEKPDVAKYILKERILRKKDPEIDSSNVLRINTQRVKKYARVMSIEEEV